VPSTRALLGAWEPDKAANLTDTLILARNVYATANGYKPVKAPSQIAPALVGPFRGGASFVAQDTTARLIAGDDTSLYSLSGGVWSSEIGSLTVSAFWQFAQFGNEAICVYGGAPVTYNLGTGAAANLTGSPPTADLVAVIDKFVVLGRTDGNILEVSWSGQGDATEWGGSGFSGSQVLTSGGKIMGITSGEYGLILQRFGITRMTPTFNQDDPFQFDVISTNYGCAAEKSVVQSGDVAFCWSDRGFIQIQGGGITPIGAEKVDRTFRETYSLADMANMWACVDPERTLVLWVMPNRVWCYNWTLQRWSDWEIPVIAAFASFSESMSLEEIEALYGDTDSTTLLTDDPIFQGGDPRLTLVGFDGAFSVLGGPNLEARFSLPFLEPALGRTARVRTATPITDAISGLELTLYYSQRLGDMPTGVIYTELRDNGDMPVRVAGRYIRPEIRHAAGSSWSFDQGIGLTFEAGGRR
jgi:hypothetical protein